ncbi:MAG: hypothetical protein ACLQVI_15835 [Polyangiaceae bacterium]
MRLTVARSLSVPASLAVAGALAVGVTSWTGCSGSGTGFLESSNGDGGTGTTTTSGSSGACQECTTSDSCTGGAVCAQFQGDTFCALACPNGDECGSGTTCTSETTFAGDQVSVCVPNNNACGTPAPTSSGPPPAPAGCDAGPVTTCGSLVGPTATASCSSCTTSTSTKTCQPNGCYGGWWCDTSTSKCQAPPTNCSTTPSGCEGSSGDGGGTTGPISVDAGGPVTGTVTGSGGTVSRLYFTAIGDTRPANEDDTSAYPTAIIDQIYSDITALNPQPLFSVSTGDYQFASTSGTQSAPQIDLYLAARAKFPGVFFPAMGNHECTGATASNCGSGNTDGVTTNYTNFLNMLLAPIKQTSPYYSININAIDGSWTSKFVFIAANAWDSAQSSWLTGVMAQPTTYTFVLRHESTGTSGPPGVSPSDTIIDAYPYTLLIVGHTHTYEHPSAKEVLFGNGGAPLTGSLDYGYGLFSQRSDGAIVVDAIDYQTGAADSSFHFVVTPTGAPTT